MKFQKESLKVESPEEGEGEGRVGRGGHGEEPAILPSTENKMEDCYLQSAVRRDCSTQPGHEHIYQPLFPRSYCAAQYRLPRLMPPGV